MSFAAGVAISKTVMETPPTSEAKIRHMVCVSDELFQQFHNDFDAGARFTTSGRKDGTDRNWVRLPSMLIVHENEPNKVLLPMSIIESTSARPLSAYAATRPLGFKEWIYGTPEHIIHPVTGEIRKNVIGHRDAEGKEHFNIGQVHREKKCDKCHTPQSDSVHLKTCAACKTFVYCSIECQRNDWTHHKPTCKAIVTKQ